MMARDDARQNHSEQDQVMGSVIADIQRLLEGERIVGDNSRIRDYKFQNQDYCIQGSEDGRFSMYTVSCSEPKGDGFRILWSFTILPHVSVKYVRNGDRAPIDLPTAGKFIRDILTNGVAI